MMRKKEKRIDIQILEKQEEKIEKFEDKMSKLKAIFQVNNYGNEKLMLNKIKGIIYDN